MVLSKIIIIAITSLLLFAPLAANAEVQWLVAGKDNALEKQLRNTSQLELVFENGADDPRRVLSAALADYSGLIDVLFAAGHLSPEISIRLDGREASEISLLSPPGTVETAYVHIVPGPIFKFGAITVTPLAAGSQLAGEMATGKPSRLDLVASAIDAAVDDWRNAGYAKAQVAAQSIVANHATNKLNVTVRLEPGQPVRFGHLIVASENFVTKARIRRIAGIPTGARFSPHILNQIAERLRASGAFASIQLREADVLNPDGTMDIIASLTDEKPRRIGFGAELSSSEGATVSAFWLHRNIFGGAQRFRLEGEVSDIGASHSAPDYVLGATLEVPAIGHADTTGLFSAEIAHEDEPDYLTDRLSLSAGLLRKFSSTISGKSNIVFEYVETEDDLGSRSFTTLSLPTEATFDHRDDVLDAVSGWFLNASITPYLSLSGDAPLLRTTVDARAYQRLDRAGSIVLAGRLQYGAIAGADISATRPDLLFHSGGGSTVRGQGFQSLGVELAPGIEVGGRSFVGASIEARIGVSDNLGIVGFVDSGYIGREISFDGSGEWHHGGGIGIRYKTPVGPIRADLAIPIGVKKTESVFIYLGIGQAF